MIFSWQSRGQAQWQNVNYILYVITIDLLLSFWGVAEESILQ